MRLSDGIAQFLLLAKFVGGEFFWLFVLDLLTENQAGDSGSDGVGLRLLDVS